MGDLIQQGITGEDRTLTGGLLAVATFVVLAVTLNSSMAKWPRLARTLEGAPVILLRDGRLNQTIMRRQRVTQGELLAAARQAGYRDLAAVDLAVLETNGKISLFAAKEQ